MIAFLPFHLTASRLSVVGGWSSPEEPETGVGGEARPEGGSLIEGWMCFSPLRKTRAKTRVILL